MKQTAVEWLVEQILQKVRNYEDGDVETEEEPFVIEYVNKYNFNIDLTKFVEQAKEMEKDQIVKTWYDCKLSIIERNPTDAEQYYKETYKSE
ncbi:MAG: hypothetical protein ACOVK2_00455 [Candidatus Fonsibacter sp.]